MFFLVHEIKHFYLDKKRFLKFIFAMGTEPRAVSGDGAPQKRLKTNDKSRKTKEFLD